PAHLASLAGQFDEQFDVACIRGRSADAGSGRIAGTQCNPGAPPPVLTHVQLCVEPPEPGRLFAIRRFRLLPHPADLRETVQRGTRDTVQLIGSRNQRSRRSASVSKRLQRLAGKERGDDDEFVGLRRRPSLRAKSKNTERILFEAARELPFRVQNSLRETLAA